MPNSVNQPNPTSNLSEIKEGLCGICPAGCWVRVHLENGIMKNVEPQTDHPLGVICKIGRHSPDIVYDPDRLHYPLRRKGEKGTYDFERISWDDAYEIIVANLQRFKKEYGPESTAIYTGRGSFDMAMCDFFQPADVAVSSASSVLFPFGSPNTLGVGALCYVSFAMIAPHVTFGEMYITMDTDIEQAELIIVWGANPATDSPPFSHQQILKARQRGAEVVVIDPRRSETAKHTGAEWLPIRPGTDGALALALINVLIEEELYDDDFATNWTVGFEELAQLVQHYRPEVVEEITTIPASKIRALARRIADARGCAPITYTGLEYSDSGVQAIRAVFTLWALAGQLDVPGGLTIRMKENIFPQNRDALIPNPNIKKALGRDRFPVYSMYRGESHAISLPQSVLHGDPYKIRCLIILGASIVTSWPNPSIWKKTLTNLDFLVTIDRYHTADSAYADLVLPATTQYETTSYMRYGPLFKIREKILEPVGEARNDFLVLAELADRLGYGHLYPRSEEEILQKALENTGHTVAEVRDAGGSVQLETVMVQYKKWQKGLLRPDGKPGFDTPSGKFEIASSILAEHGYDPMPVYTEPEEGPLNRPDLAGKFPLVFNSGARTYFDFRSQHHGVKSLTRNQPQPVVTINSADAKSRNITDGDLVCIKTPRGQMNFTAKVTDDIIAGAVDANMGGGGPLGPEAWQRCNVNELTALDHYDPISGFPIYKTLLCQIEKIASVNAPQSERTHDEPTENVQAAGHIKTRSPQRQVYLDHNATTPLDPEVLEAMIPYLTDRYGNPSSIHSPGSHCRTPLEEARRKTANLLNCTARRIIFTSGGSEANNLAIKGTTSGFEKGHLIASNIEHPAVSDAFQALQQKGFQLTILAADSEGLISPATLKKAIRDDTVLISVMLANNEFGTIQPINELTQIARENNILFHTDAVQAAGKVPVDVNELGVDLLTISAHKMYGPKGIGALYVRKGIELQPLIHGGGQERGLRSGTENVSGIVGFGKACELAIQRLSSDQPEQLRLLCDELEAGIQRLIPAARLNGSKEHRLPNTLNMILPGLRGESLVLALDRRGLYFSSGSACKSGNPAPSNALLALGLSDEEAHCSIRLSLGKSTTRVDVDYFLNCLQELLKDKLGSVRFVPCR